MKYQDETNWIALNYPGSSLRDVLGNGTFQETNLTVTEWKKLLNNSKIQVKKNLTILDAFLFLWWAFSMGELIQG